MATGAWNEAVWNAIPWNGEMGGEIAPTQIVCIDAIAVCQLDQSAVAGWQLDINADTVWQITTEAEVPDC